MNDFRGRGLQPIRSSSGSLASASIASASLPGVNIDERTLAFSGDEIGSSPNIPASSSTSAVTSFFSSAALSTTGVDSVSLAAFLDDEIPSMLARKSQCPDFFPPVSEPTASLASSLDFSSGSSANSTTSSLTTSSSDSLSNSSSSIGSTFFDAFPPK